MDTAIKLFFLNEYPVSVHILTSAANIVLYDILKRVNTSFHFEIDIWIKPQHLKEWKDKINEASNFFKHADRDFDKKIVFEEATNELKLYQCCVGYVDFTKAFSPSMKIFMCWMKLFYTRIFKLEDEELLKIKNAFQANYIDPENSETSLRIGTELMRKEGLLYYK